MSTSAWPTPTVSSRTTSRPAASISSAACSAASLSPPSAPRLAIERMNTPGSRKWSVRRIRSPSRAPWVNGEEGSIDSTATVRSRARSSLVSAPSSVDLPAPGGPVKPMIGGAAGAGIDLLDQRPALWIIVLDQRDPAGERAAVAGRAGVSRAIRRCRASVRAIMPGAATEAAAVRRIPPCSQRAPSSSSATAPDPVPPVRPLGPPPCTAVPLTFLRFARDHHMLRPGYAVLIARWAVAEAPLARAAADRRSVLRVPGGEVRDRA